MASHSDAFACPFLDRVRSPPVGVSEHDVLVPGTSSIGSTRVSSRVVPHVALLLPRFAADAEEPADLDRDVPRALALDVEKLNASTSATWQL